MILCHVLFALCVRDYSLCILMQYAALVSFPLTYVFSAGINCRAFYLISDICDRLDCYRSVILCDVSE